MINVLHISRTMGQGGAEKVVYQLCEDCVDKNIKMYIASTGGTLADELEKKGIINIKIPDIDHKNPFMMLKTICILFNAIRKYKISIVHSHHRMAAFYSRIINIFNKKFKRIYTAHNIFNNKKRLLRFALWDSKIIAVGNGVKKNLIDFFGISKEKIIVIYNSIKFPKIEENNKDEKYEKKSEKLIATIGRLTEQKGIDIFIKAMSEIIKQDPKIYGIIIGDGKLREELEELSQKLNIQNNIIFLGYRKDVLNLISKVDFVVLASRWEGFPLTPIETFMMGKTIIVSDIDGNNEIVKEGINGLLFKKNDIKDLKNKIEILCNDIEKRKNLEINAKKEYDEIYSYEKFNNSYKKEYLKLK